MRAEDDSHSSSAGNALKDKYPSSQVPLSGEHSEKESTEDEEALNQQALLRGLPYDSCLQREDLEDSCFTVAPG